MTKVVVLVTNSINTSYGGIGPFVKNLDVHLSEYYDLDYITLPDYFDNITIVPHRFLYFMYMFFNYFKLRKYDMVISHSHEGAYACSIFGRPFIHVYHGNDNPVSVSRFWYGKYFISLFNHATKMISEKSLIGYTVGKEEVGRKKILNPISHDISQKDFSERSGFIFAGRLEKGKRVELILESYALLPAEIKESNKLKIAGKGSQLEFLQEKVNELKLNKNVEFLGILDNRSLIEQISKSKIFLMASGFEGFPMVIAEAFSVGVPSVSTDVGDIPRFLKSGENGMLVEKDFKFLDFANAVQKILENYEHFASNAFEAGKLFDAKKIATDLVKDINTLIEAK
ncbi:glycosyltransferase family 4 protein [Algoriphagus sp.]|uniref:glycosyltransferase family 4 protein n=1 Tax=Algoriphagus sp. TaxID=1872435 RepID=UPI0025D60C3B|nr:glycosyltransferase family 4 protein [Algoriphagus sp.]